MFSLITFLHRAIMQGIPLLFGSTGEIMTEKSGNLNLGIPGVMYIGGMSGDIMDAWQYIQKYETI
jgi:general nucleoside transport system permease protein